MRLVNEKAFYQAVNEMRVAAAAKKVLNFAELWADNMEFDMARTGQTVADLAEKTAAELNAAWRLTNGDFRSAVRFLVTHWVYGEELRAWYDSQYPTPLSVEI